MSHSYNKIWIHSIYATKNREPFIDRKIEPLVHQHIREQLIEMECPVRLINGIEDHVHLLFLLNPKMAIVDVLKQVKGNTSHWINEQKLVAGHFAWQTGYAAYSVSESQLEKVYWYIRNQKQHHKKQSSRDEYDKFISLHGLISE